MWMNKSVFRKNRLPFFGGLFHRNRSQKKCQGAVREGFGRIGPAPFTAILTPGCGDPQGARAFPAPSREIWNYESVAGTVPALRRLAEAASESGLESTSLTRSLIIFTGFGREALTPEDRDLFWRVFQVPIFEQFLGPDGELLAIECEAHEGLHIRHDCRFELQGSGELTAAVDGTAPWDTGLTACVTSEMCACGEPGPRLVEMLPLARSAAACRAD
jgi:hypothetical protein